MPNMFSGVQHNRSRSACVRVGIPPTGTRSVVSGMRRVIGETLCCNAIGLITSSGGSPQNITSCSSTPPGVVGVFLFVLPTKCCEAFHWRSGALAKGAAVDFPVLSPEINPERIYAGAGLGRAGHRVVFHRSVLWISRLGADCRVVAGSFVDIHGERGRR